jgi:TP901 family phage tail tape measure protein
MTMNNFNFGYNFTATNGVTPALNQINTGMDQLEQNSKEAGAATTKAFFDIENASKIAAHGMAAFEAMQGMKRDFADFEAGIAESSTLVKGADVDMAEYTAKIMEYSKKYGEAPAAMTKTLYTAMSSGFLTAAESSAILEESMKLAVGGVTTSAEAMDGMTTIMHSWGLTTQDVGRISDTLFVGMRAGKCTIGELSKEIGQVSALANLSGISIEELTAAAAALTLGGRTTSESFNGLRAILTEVLRQEPGVIKATKELGAEFSLSALRSKGLTQFMNDLQKAVMKQGDEAKWASIFGRVQGLGAAISLTGTQAGIFADIMEQMNDKVGSTDDAVNKMLKTSKYQTKQYEASVMIMRIKMGQALRPIFDIWKRIRQAFVDMVTTVAQKAPWLVQLIGVILLIGAAFAIVIAKIIAAKALMLMLGVFVKSLFAGMIGAIAAMGPVLAIVAAAILAVVGTILVLRKAYEENWSGFADWVDHATQSVAAFADAIKQLWTTGEINGPTAEFLMMNKAVWDVTQAVWYLVEAFKFLWMGIVDGFGKVETLLEPFKGAFIVVSRMFEHLGKIWKDIFGEFTEGSEEPVTIMGVMAALGYTLGITLKLVFQVIAGGLAAVMVVFGAAMGVVYSLFMLVWRVFRGLYRILTGDFLMGLMEVSAAVFQFFAGILSIFVDLLDGILFALASMFGVTRDQYEGFFAEVAVTLGIFWGWMTAGFNATIRGIVSAWEWCGEAFQAVVDAMGAAWDYLASGMRGAWAWVTEGFITGLSFIGEAFKIVGDYIKAAWEAIFKWFEDKFGWLKDAIGWVGDAASKVANVTGAAFDAVTSGVTGGLGAVSDFITGSGGGPGSEKVASFFKNPGMGFPPDDGPAPAVPSRVLSGLTQAGAVDNTQAASISAANIAALSQAFGMSMAEMVQVTAKMPSMTMKMDGKVVAELISDRMKDMKEGSMSTVIPTLTSGGM